MKRVILSATLLTLGIATLKAQVNLGSNAVADASAMLQVTSTTKGFRPPQVSLGSTTTFGLTAATSASAAYGMIVYNSNAGITGTTTYPAYGTGIYSWDGTGWKSNFYGTKVEYVGNGVASAAQSANTPVTLDLSTTYFQSANVTVSGSNTLTLNSAGTYKIDVVMSSIASAGTSDSNNGDNICNILINGSVVDQSSTTSSVATSGTTNNVIYRVVESYIRTSTSAGDKIQIQGWTTGTAITYAFRVISLQITRIQ